jgi:hypothetical protein
VPAFLTAVEGIVGGIEVDLDVVSVLRDELRRTGPRIAGTEHLW